jgi:hypothetical protein
MDFIAEYYATKLEIMKYGSTTGNSLAHLSHIHSPMMDVIYHRQGTYFDSRSIAVYDCLQKVSEQIPVHQEALPPTPWKFEEKDREVIRQLLSEYFRKVFLPQYVPDASFRFLSYPIEKYPRCFY